MRSACAAALLLLAFSACIVKTGSTTSAPPPPERIPVPDKFTGAAPPELVEVGVEGCKQAPKLDPNLYYCEKDEHWFRYAMNRWYLAFEWDGNWFPATGSDLPRSLAALTPRPEEVQKSREQRLKELEEKLKKIDEQQPQKGGN